MLLAGRQRGLSEPDSASTAYTRQRRRSVWTLEALSRDRKDPLKTDTTVEKMI